METIPAYARTSFSEKPSLEQIDADQDRSVRNDPDLARISHEATAHRGL